MRIHLSLGYVLLRTCDTPMSWVGWCPELDVMSQGRDLNEAIWMVREAARLTVEECVRMNRHPLRRRTDPVPDDPDWAAYQEFRSSDDADYRVWSSTSRASELPAPVSTCFISTGVWIDTNGGSCLISDDEGYGPSISYKSGKLVRVRVLEEGVIIVDTQQVGEVTVESINRRYGPGVREILSIDDR